VVLTATSSSNNPIQIAIRRDVRIATSLLSLKIGRVCASHPPEAMHQQSFASHFVTIRG
jgi:hypothetical protein